MVWCKWIVKKIGKFIEDVVYEFKFCFVMLGVFVGLGKFISIGMFV